MTMPFGTYITPNRVTGLAAVFCSAVSGGTIASSSGSASVAPMPRRTVRRGIAFLVISMGAPTGLAKPGGGGRCSVVVPARSCDSCAVLIVNGMLVATPMITDDQR